jgi:hypothetical protein
VTEEHAESVLGHIRGMLRADGYDLLIRVSDDDVAVSVVATDGACADCLVPAEIMIQIVRDSLVEGSDGDFAGKVSVTYPS